MMKTRCLAIIWCLLCLNGWAQEFVISYPEKITDLFSKHAFDHFKGDSRSCSVFTYEVDTSLVLDTLRDRVSIEKIAWNEHGKVVWTSEKMKMTETTFVTCLFYDSLNRIVREETFFKYINDSIRCSARTYSYSDHEWIIHTIGYVTDETERIINYRQDLILLDDKNRIYRLEAQMLDPLTKQKIHQFEPTLLEYDEVNFRLIISESEKNWKQNTIYFYGGGWSEPPSSILYNIGDISFETNYDYTVDGDLISIRENRIDEDGTLSRRTIIQVTKNSFGDYLEISRSSTFEAIRVLMKFQYP